MKIIRLLPLLISLLLLYSGVSAQVQPTLEMRLTELALQRNPELTAAHYDWQQAKEQVTIADSLDDPVLSLSLQNYPVDSLAYDESPMTGNEIRVSQKVPYPGKLATRTAIGELAAFTKHDTLREKQLKVSRLVRETYYRYLLQNSTLDILEQTRQLLNDQIRSFELNYATGKATQQQVLAAQQQQTKLLERLIIEKSSRDSLLGILQQVIPGPLPIAELEQQRLPGHLPTLPKLEAGLAQATQERPLFQLYQHLGDQYQQQHKLARLDEKPDFTLWSGYRFRDGGPMDSVQGADMVSVGVSFNLPWFNGKRKAQAQAAKHMRNRAEAELDNSRNQVRFNLEEAHRRMTRLEEQINLYQQVLIPQTQAASQAVISNYQQNHSGYQKPLETLLQLLNQRLTLEQYHSEYLVNYAWYQAETGELLP